MNLPHSIQQLSGVKQQAFIAAYEYLERHNDIPKAKALAMSMLVAERAGERSGQKATEEGQMFAVNFADNGTLLAVQEQLRDLLPPDTQWTEPGDFHLTLVYLPEGGADSLYPDKVYLFSAFDTPASLVSIFDTPDAYAVVVLLAKNNDLLMLQHMIFNQCHELGLTVGSFSLPSQYNPHITLAYIPKKEGQRLPYFEASYPLIFPVEEVAFYGSFNEITRVFELPVSDETLEAEADEGYEEEEKSSKSLVQRLIDWWRGVKTEAALTFEAPQGFKMLTNDRWVAWYTNAYQDKDGEIFATKAIEKDVQFMWEKQEFPELWFWHIGNPDGARPTRHGKADWVGMVGRFAVATGTFDSTPLAQAMKAYYEKNPVELSHGFYYDPAQKRNGVFNAFHTFEISTLPAGKAANPFTAFELGEKTMPLTDAQKSALNNILGADEASKLLAEVQEASKALDQEVAFKAAAPDAEEDVPDMKGYMQKMDERMAAYEGKMSEMMGSMTKMADMMKAMMVPATAEPEQEKKDFSPRAAQADVPVDDRKQALIAEMQANTQAKSIPERKSPAEFLFSMGQ